MPSTPPSAEELLESAAALYSNPKNTLEMRCFSDAADSEAADAALFEASK